VLAIYIMKKSEVLSAQPVSFGTSTIWLVLMNFVDVGQSVLTARIDPSKFSSSGIASSSMQSYARTQDRNTYTLSSRGQMVDTNEISMAVNQGKRSGINHYLLS
jgi:hypothetical protein